MKPAYDELKSAAEMTRVADQAYQLAMANGDPLVIKQALTFWRQCDADYQDALKRHLKAAKRRPRH